MLTPAAVDKALQARLFALANTAFGDSVACERAEPLAGDASTRSYARLWLRGPGAPATAIAMILADRGIAMSSDELAVFKETPKQLPYVNVHHFLERLGLAIPRIYADQSENGLLLLEDIGDTALWDQVQQQPQQAGIWYRRAIDQLLTLQIDGTRAADSSCIAFQQSFDERLFVWEFEHFIEHGIEKRGIDLDPADAERMRAAFAVIARRLAEAPRFLNHRDYHSWNLHVQGDSIRVIDFQDALLAPATYDLATLLGDRDTPQIVTPELERELVAYYHEQWHRRGGPAVPFRELEAQYFDCAFQKALKVVGRFHFLATVKGKPGYLRFLPSTIRQVQRLLPRYPQLADILPRYL